MAMLYSDNYLDVIFHTDENNEDRLNKFLQINIINISSVFTKKTFCWFSSHMHAIPNYMFN